MRIPHLISALLLFFPPAHGQILEVVAGTGERGFSSVGGPATQARLQVPFAVFVDEAGHVYIADVSNNRIRKVDTDGTITTVAGTGEDAHTGDRGSGANVIYVPEWTGHTVRRINAGGIITSVAGTGVYGYTGEGGSALEARLWTPTDVFRTGNGSIYVTEWNNQRVRRIDPDGSIVQPACSWMPMAHFTSPTVATIASEP